VPVMVAGFDFGTPAIAKQLTGKLAVLQKYNGLEIPKGYFFPAMDRLRNKFLNVSVDAVLHPASDSAQQVAKEQKDKATIALGEVLLGANNMSLRLVGAEVMSSVALRPKISSRLRTARILLNLENVCGLSDATVDVYINVPKRNVPAKHPDHFAGTVALLGLREATLVKDKYAGDGLTFVLEITRVIDTLYLAGALDMHVRQLQVRLVPLKPVPEVARVNIGRISIWSDSLGDEQRNPAKVIKNVRGVDLEPPAKAVSGDGETTSQKPKPESLQKAPIVTRAKQSESKEDDLIGSATLLFNADDNTLNVLKYAGMKSVAVQPINNMIVFQPQSYIATFVFYPRQGPFDVRIDSTTETPGLNYTVSENEDRFVSVRVTRGYTIPHTHQTQIRFYRKN
jgi:hypothetical protein